MDVKTINDLLARGEIGHNEMWPHLSELKLQPVQFRFEFGLEEIPTEPGVIVVRGPRQYGKSTWLEMFLKETVEKFSKGSAYFLSGDDIASNEKFSEKLTELNSAFSKDAAVKRIFIDEVTTIPDWQKGLKRVRDRGVLRDVLVVTTGSKALDLRRGSERLPGRKGKLQRSDYIFLPVSYQEFVRATHSKWGAKTWVAYLISGGCPIACNELYRTGRIPDFFVQLIRDWIYGEVISSGRERFNLTNLLHVLFRYAGSPVGFAKLSREAGLANNTVASGYIEQLTDLLSVIPSWPWDHNKKLLQARKPCKFHFINMACAMAFHASNTRRVEEFDLLSAWEQAILLEWLVAQEIWRRSVLNLDENPEAIGFWASHEHEIDFVTPSGAFVEVKRGTAGPLDFAWFSKVFPKSHLVVVCQAQFETRQVRGIGIDDFLSKGWQ